MNKKNDNTTDFDIVDIIGENVEKAENAAQSEIPPQGDEDYERLLRRARLHGDRNSDAHKVHP